jgi:hypothetical protein
MNPGLRAAAQEVGAWTVEHLADPAIGDLVVEADVPRRLLLVTLSLGAHRRVVRVEFARGFGLWARERAEARAYIRGVLDFESRLMGAVGHVAGGDGCHGHEGLQGE